MVTISIVRLCGGHCLIEHISIHKWIFLENTVYARQSMYTHYLLSLVDIVGAVSITLQNWTSLSGWMIQLKLAEYVFPLVLLNPVRVTEVTEEPSETNHTGIRISHTKIEKCINRSWIWVMVSLWQKFYLRWSFYFLKFHSNWA